jgi:hypothetical protein
VRRKQQIKARIRLFFILVIRFGQGRKMRELICRVAVLFLIYNVGIAQTNRIVYGPLEGDNAGTKMVHSGDAIEVEMWVRTDPGNPAPIVAISHALTTEDAIIASRQGVNVDPYYDMPNWEAVFTDGPFIHDPGDEFPIPVGHTCEIVVGIYSMFQDPPGEPLDTQGEWDYYGSFLMTCQEDIPPDNTYYPFSTGWYPHSGQGTSWSFEDPPGGQIEPQQDYCGLYVIPQTNRIVFGPLVGDDAGILTGHPAEPLDVEMWVRTDPDNPAPIVAVSHALLTDDAVIAMRQGAFVDADYDMPNWESVFVDGPFSHNPDDNCPIPVGHTCEIVVGIYSMFQDPPGDPLDTQGEWDYYGAFRMTCDEDIEVDQTYDPFSLGWYPHSGEGTDWSYEDPPGGSVVPEQVYCSLLITELTCEYFRGDCDHNGVPYELNDVITMLGMYRNTIEPSYFCSCPPHGDDFVPQADVNGNCIPFELNDAIVMINVYRGEAEPSACPDCPGMVW